MTNLTTISRLACLSTVLATGVVLMTSAGIANARGNSNHGNNAHNSGAASQSMINGQSSGEKKILSDRKSNGKKDKQAKKDKGCEKITVPTPGCAISPHDPVGSVHTGAITGGSKAPPAQSAGGPTAPTGPSPAATPVALSNGLTKSVIENGKGLTVTSNSPGTITVSNGTSSVTMAGGSLTLHGAQSVSAGSGLQLVRLSNGDVSIAVSPILMGGASKSAPVPPGVGLTDDLKAMGNYYSLLSSAPQWSRVASAPVIGATTLVMLPAATITGIASGDLKGAIKDLGNFAHSASDWVADLF